MKARMTSSAPSQFDSTDQYPAAFLLARDADLFERFSRAYCRLRAMPQRARRSLQRRAAVSLAALALLLAFAGAPAALASTITVADGAVVAAADGHCSLVEAILNANDTEDGIAPTTGAADCAAGSPTGADTIQLPVKGNFVVSVAHSQGDNGPNGLPAITGSVTIEGNGSTISRAQASAGFRLLEVRPGGDLVLRQLSLSGGDAGDEQGGAILVLGKLSALGVRLEGNRAESGGAVAAWSEAEVNLDETTISGNTAGGSGGGLYASEATVVVADSTIGGNTAESGGGVAAVQGAATFLRSTLSGNEAAVEGGAVYIYDATVMIANSTVSGNRAEYGAGASNHGRLTLCSATVVLNTAVASGGGVYNAAEANLGMGRALVSGNVAPEGREIFNAKDGVVLANNFNLFGSGGSAGISGFTAGAHDLVPALGRLAILGDLADNGGPTKTHALAGGSPAIDAAPTSNCNTLLIGGVDQRGEKRGRNGAGGPTANECDIGAFEAPAVEAYPWRWFAPFVR